MDNHKSVAKTHQIQYRNLVPSTVRTTKHFDEQPEIVTWLSVGQPIIFP